MSGKRHKVNNSSTIAWEQPLHKNDIKKD